VHLSGATIQTATGHHYEMMRLQGVGPGGFIEVVRSGMVIPKIERVIQRAVPIIPTHCPSCDAKLVQEGDYLICPNKTACPAQIENTILHFFKTIKNADGFGPKTITKLFERDITSIQQIYALDKETFVSFGFGEKTSQNLIDQLERSRREPLEDWRFLAALGVYRLGPGMCERLLQYYKLEDVFNLDAEKLREYVDGFEKITAEAAINGLHGVSGLFQDLYALGFNLQRTPLITEGFKSAKDSPISGKRLVFSGAMKSGSREEMKRQAKVLGAKVGSSVTGKTDFLVVGEGAGGTKVTDATKKKAKIITEEQYLEMIEKKQ
jgi:DNA ligase (NAD+)